MKPELEKEIDQKALALIQQTRMETDGKFYREMVSTIKQYAQDTDRLNWLLSHPGADIDKAVVTGRGIWRVVWYSEGKHYISWGEDMRHELRNQIARQNWGRKFHELGIVNQQRVTQRVDELEASGEAQGLL